MTFNQSGATECVGSPSHRPQSHQYTAVSWKYPRPTVPDENDLMTSPEKEKSPPPAPIVEDLDTASMKGCTATSSGRKRCSSNYFFKLFHKCFCYGRWRRAALNFFLKKCIQLRFYFHLCTKIQLYFLSSRDIIMFRSE